MYTMPKTRMNTMHTMPNEEEADNTQVEVDPQSQDEFDEDDQDSYL